MPNYFDYGIIKFMNIAIDEMTLALAEHLGQILVRKKNKIAVAESCTGGLVAAVLTEFSGSSDYFERGFVTYSNEAKQEMLGVEVKTLEQFGAVSEETAREMAIGAIKNSRAEISIAVTGIAGPTGGSGEKPVGTVCFAWQLNPEKIITTTKHFSGDRDAVRAQAVKFALKELVRLLT